MDNRHLLNSPKCFAATVANYQKSLIPDLESVIFAHVHIVMYYCVNTNTFCIFLTSVCTGLYRVCQIQCVHLHDPVELIV